MMLNFQRSLALHSIIKSKPIFMFTSSWNQTKWQNQEVDRHKAILATRIISMIQNTPYNLHIYVIPKKEVTEVSSQATDKVPEENWKPLRQQILDYIDQYPDGQTSNEKPSSASIAKKILRSYFFGGVWILNDFCGQDRFSGPFGQKTLRQIKQNFKYQIVELNGPDEQSQVSELKRYKKIEFCPTYLVSGQVFQILSQRAYSYSTLLQIGHLGIGKSHSVVLYRSLSDMVFRYKHLYCELGQKAPEGIDFHIIKLIYWNIDLKENQRNTIFKIVESQCYEIQKYLKQMRRKADNENKKHPEIQILKEFGNYLSPIYIKLRIDAILIIDNIIQIANAKRKLRNRYDARILLDKQIDEIKQSDLADRNKKIRITLMENKFQKIHGRAEEILYLRQHISKLMMTKDELFKHFPKVYYLSSINIQKWLLQKLQLTGKYDNAQIWQKKFKYHQYLQHPTSKSDIIEFIIVLLGQRFLEMNLNVKTLSTLSNQQEKLLKKGRQILISIVNQIFEISSPKAIYDYLKKCPYEDLQKLQASQMQQSQPNQNPIDENQSEVKKFFINLIEGINQIFSAQIEQQIQNFLPKTNKKNYSKILQQKKILLLKLLLAAKSKIKQRTESSDLQPNIIEIETTNILTCQQKYKYQQEISQILDQNFFNYSSFSGFKCFLSENMIIRLLEKNQKNFLQALWASNQNIHEIFKNQSMIGGLIESLIKKTITQGKGKTFLKFQFQKEILVLKLDDSNFIKKKQVFNHYDHKNEFTEAFKNVKQGPNFFFPIPTKLPEKNIKNKKFENYKMFYFLNSFEKTLKQIPIGNHLFLPSKDGIKIFRQSKLIDFIIVQKRKEQIILNIFDPTVGYSDGQKKIRRFLEEYLLFIDSSKNQISLQGTKYKVTLNYTVLLPRLPQYPITSYLDFEKIKEQKISFLQDIESYNDGLGHSKYYDKKDFLKNLESIKSYGFIDYGQTLVFYQSKDENEPKNEILLRRVSVASFLDIEFRNKVQKRILLYKRLMERYRSELQELEKQQQQQKIRNIKQRSPNQKV